MEIFFRLQVKEKELNRIGFALPNLIIINFKNWKKSEYYNEIKNDFIK